MNFPVLNTTRYPLLVGFNLAAYMYRARCNKGVLHVRCIVLHDLARTLGENLSKPEPNNRGFSKNSVQYLLR